MEDTAKASVVTIAEARHLRRHKLFAPPERFYTRFVESAGRSNVGGCLFWKMSSTLTTSWSSTSAKPWMYPLVADEPGGFSFKHLLHWFEVMNVVNG